MSALPVISQLGGGLFEPTHTNNYHENIRSVVETPSLFNNRMIQTRVDMTPDELQEF